MKKPLRILHIVGKMNQGGIETLLMNLYREIDRSAVQFDFLTHSNAKGFFDEEIRSLGGKIYSVVSPFCLKGMLYYKRELLDFFKGHPEYAIVHSHMNTFSGIILNIAKKAGVPTRIAHSHTTVAASGIKTPLWKLSRVFGQDAVTHRFACSRDAAKWSFGKHAEKAAIFKNAIDLEKYQFSDETRTVYRNELSIEEKFVVGHVGRFNEIKNHAFLLEIFAKLHKKNHNARLLLAGDGPLLPNMQEKARTLGIADSVIFLGNRNDVDKLLCAMDVFVFPSTNEGLGIVAIEAQASGLHCLVSDALPEEVKVTGLLEYASLQKGAEYWAFRILEYPMAHNRKNASFEVKKQGYDIKESAEWLADFYIAGGERSKEDV